MDEYILAFYNSAKPSETDLERKKQVITVLNNVIIRQFAGDQKGVSLRVIGSSETGLGTSGSDLDLVLRLPFEPPRKDVFVLLATIESLLRRSRLFTDIHLITTARHPIVKFRHIDTKVNCDLGIHSGYYGKVGLLNTALVKCYCRADPRVIPLIMFVKEWARKKGILESRFALGSYAIELMVLNYLQCCNPAVLPSLQQSQPEIFGDVVSLGSGALDDVIGDWQLPHRLSTSNKLTVGQLFFGVIQHYANFDFQNHLISVRAGKYFRRGSSEWMYNDFRFDHSFINIEEPYNRTNVGHTVSRVENFMFVVQAFRNTASLLLNGQFAFSNSTMSQDASTASQSNLSSSVKTASSSSTASSQANI